MLTKSGHKAETKSTMQKKVGLFCNQLSGYLGPFFSCTAENGGAVSKQEAGEDGPGQAQ